MTEIVIQGIGGRMGHVLCDLIAQREDCCVVAGIDVSWTVNLPEVSWLLHHMYLSLMG